MEFHATEKQFKSKQDEVCKKQHFNEGLFYPYRKWEYEDRYNEKQTGLNQRY